MNILQFKAFAVTNEIDLNKIAIRCSIRKKYTWEEPLILRGEVLNTILEYETERNQSVMVFAFGSIVYINCNQEEIEQILYYIKKQSDREIDLMQYKKYSDDFEMRIGIDEEINFTDEYINIPHFEVFYPELVATVIAKSVALEKTEEQLEKISDRLEGMIDRLQKGNLRISDKELAKTVSSIVRHEYNTISYIMILDKPDITWIHSDAADFYNQMSEFFELNDRFEIMQRKTEILNNIISGFSSISHSIRGLVIEYVIVILIVMEVILMIADYFKA